MGGVMKVEKKEGGAGDDERVYDFMTRRDGNGSGWNERFVRKECRRRREKG